MQSLFNIDQENKNEEVSSQTKIKRNKNLKFKKKKKTLKKQFACADSTLLFTKALEEPRIKWNRMQQGSESNSTWNRKQKTNRWGKTQTYAILIQHWAKNKKWRGQYSNKDQEKQKF